VGSHVTRHRIEISSARVELMRVLKSLIFYPLLWLRGLFVLIGKVLGGFFLLGFLLVGGLKLAGELVVSGWIVAFYGVAGLLVFTLSEFYDQLLLWLNPTRRELLLIK